MCKSLHAQKCIKTTLMNEHLNFLCILYTIYHFKVRRCKLLHGLDTFNTLTNTFLCEFLRPLNKLIKLYNIVQKGKIFLCIVLLILFTFSRFS